jgi:hypothetical protein
MKNFPKASLNLFISLKVEIMSFTTNWVLAIKWPYCNCFVNVVIKKIKLILKKPPSRKSSLTKFYYLKNLCRTDLFGTGMMTKESLLISMWSRTKMLMSWTLRKLLKWKTKSTLKRSVDLFYSFE